MTLKIAYELSITSAISAGEAAYPGLSIASSPATYPQRIRSMSCACGLVNRPAATPVCCICIVADPFLSTCTFALPPRAWRNAAAPSGTSRDDQSTPSVASRTRSIEA